MVMRFSIVLKSVVLVSAVRHFFTNVISSRRCFDSEDFIYRVEARGFELTSFKPHSTTARTNGHFVWWLKVVDGRGLNHASPSVLYCVNDKLVVKDVSSVGIR